MKATASGGNPLNTDTRISRVQQHRGGTYQRAYDERKRPIRGLWVRGGWAHDRNLHGSGGEGEGVIAGGVKVGAGSPKVLPLAAPFDATQGQNIFRPGF